MTTCRRSDSPAPPISWRFGSALGAWGNLIEHPRSGGSGLWRSLVAHLTGGQGVAGSNPVSPTIAKPLLTWSGGVSVSLPEGGAGLGCGPVVDQPANPGHTGHVRCDVAHRVQAGCGTGRQATPKRATWAVTEADNSPQSNLLNDCPTVSGVDSVGTTGSGSPASVTIDPTSTGRRHDPWTIEAGIPEAADVDRRTRCAPGSPARARAFGRQEAPNDSIGSRIPPTDPTDVHDKRGRETTPCGCLHSPSLAACRTGSRPGLHPPVRPRGDVPRKRSRNIPGSPPHSAGTVTAAAVSACGKASAA